LVPYCSEIFKTGAVPRRFLTKNKKGKLNIATGINVPVTHFWSKSLLDWVNFTRSVDSSVRIVKLPFP
jgi:hypothetical protein